MKRFIIALIALGALVGSVQISASGSAARVAASEPTVSTDSALVQLVGDPLSVSPRSRPSKGKKIDFDSAGVKSERARLVSTRNEFKQWLKSNAPNAQVTNEFDIAVNAVGVTAERHVVRARCAPRRWCRGAELQQRLRPAAHEIRTSPCQTTRGLDRAGGEANAGAGVKVAIIDSGIDVTHPCFDDTGYAAADADRRPRADQQQGHRRQGVLATASSRTGLDATAVNAHGTHVAGTVACNAHTPAVINGVDIPYDPSGVAPRALLGNYNVFPGDTGSARSEDILDALEDAYADGIRGRQHEPRRRPQRRRRRVPARQRHRQPRPGQHGRRGGRRATKGRATSPSTTRVRRRARSPPVPAPSATASSTSSRSPASTTRRSSATSPTLDSRPHRSARGRVRPGAAGSPHGLNLACDGGPPLPDLTGTIALLGRGVCDFTVKMRNAQNAGAVGVIMVDRIRRGAVRHGPQRARAPADHPGLHGQPRGRRGHRRPRR